MCRLVIHSRTVKAPSTGLAYSRDICDRIQWANDVARIAIQVRRWLVIVEKQHRNILQIFQGRNLSLCALIREKVIQRPWLEFQKILAARQ